MSTGPSKTVTVKGVELQLDMISAGLLAVFPAETAFVIAGKSYSLADLVAEVDSRRALYKSARDLRNQLKALTQEKRDRRREMGSFVKDVRFAVTAMLGRRNPDLAKVGFPVEKERAPQTAAEKDLRAVRARETRKARHTLGAKQKASIKSEVHEATLVELGGAVHAIPHEASGPASEPASPASHGSTGA